MYSNIAANKRKTYLIFIFFLAFVGALGWLFSAYLGQPLITPYVLVGASIYALFTYFAGARMAIAVNGAKQIQKKDNPRLWRIVENLAITDGLPMPKVYIMNDPALNAFATGRNPKKAIVCATSGILEALDDDELEGVMAHELGHVKNYDIRVSMLAFALVSVISLMADIILHFTWFRGDDRENTNPVIMIAGLAAMIIAPIAASMIQLAISRRREYLADATGALTTRYPEGLASALEKIGKGGSVTARANSSTAHLFFANPLRKGSFASLFSTHPPIEERIKALRNMGNKL
ncbi:MAG TPA: M48 family metalloprotease [Candidatus Saccharimonadales bacterium]|nr:M48 family metalloprotease [Candidatus Saccharimonadales bacterium]